MHGFRGFTTEPIRDTMKEIVDIVKKKKKKVRCKGFQDRDLGEIQELTDTTPEE